MSMSTAGGADRGLTNEPNVTPMIDVLLVLLIIFMMILPMSRKALDVQLPDPTPVDQPKNVKSNQIVLEVKVGPAFEVNKEPVPRERLMARLKEIYDPRPEKIMFVKGDNDVLYQDVIFAMDAARGAGVKVLGATPKPAEETPAP